MALVKLGKIHIIFIVVLMLCHFTQAKEKNTGMTPGFKENLANHGINAGFVYKGDWFRVAKGGLSNRNAFLSNLDFTFEIDADKLLRLPNTTVFLYMLGNTGQSPSEYAGDAQTLSNIDAPEAIKLYEAWIQHEFFGEKLSILAGLFDLNSEFDAISTGGLFLNSSHGIGPDFSQSGINGPSIFPTTSLGMRLHFSKNSFHLRSAAWDGVAGDPNHAQGITIKFGENDGLLIANQINYEKKDSDGDEFPALNIALGSWFYTEDAERLDNGRGAKNWGIYSFIDKWLFSEQNDRKQGVSAFVRFGIADQMINQFDRYFGGGMVYAGPFSDNSEEQFGVALAFAHNSRDFRQTTPEAENYEIAIELTYRTAISQYIVLQPDVQYIINPGTMQHTRNALVPGVRLEIAF